MAEQMVAVGCKHPAGLVLNLDHYEVVGDNKQVIRHEHGATVTLNGNAFEKGKVVRNVDEVAGGYRITMAPKSFMDEWMKRNADGPLVKNGVIICQASQGSATAEAREKNKNIPTIFPPAKDGDVKGVKKNDNKDE